MAGARGGLSRIASGSSSHLLASWQNAEPLASRNDTLNKTLDSLAPRHEDLQEKNAVQLLMDLDKVPEEIRTSVRNYRGGTLATACSGLA